MSFILYKTIPTSSLPRLAFDLIKQQEIMFLRTNWLSEGFHVHESVENPTAGNPRETGVCSYIIPDGTVVIYSLFKKIYKLSINIVKV